jgi:hypothetical protein
MDQLLAQSWPNFARTIESLRNTLPEVMLSASKRSQLNALTGALAPPAKVLIYEKLSYRIIDTEIPLILGDAGLLFQVADQKPFRTVT